MTVERESALNKTIICLNFVSRLTLYTFIGLFIHVDVDWEGLQRAMLSFGKNRANFEGLLRETLVMEWAGKDCDFSIERAGARWISLICLWMAALHSSC